MGKIYDEIDEHVRAFIAAQQMFFVATAPLGADGHVNVSPKALDGFRVLGPRQVAYLDYPGSGIETVAHIRENERLTIMFCAFSGSPNILRLYGKGHVVETQDEGFEALLAHFAPQLAVRSIIVLSVTRIADACGFGVPLYEHKGPRDQLARWAERKGEEGLIEYKRAKNSTSIDGLPGLRNLGEPSS